MQHMKIPNNLLQGWIKLVPDKEQLDYEIFQNNEISFTVPKISGHCMIELSYK